MHTIILTGEPRSTNNIYKIKTNRGYPEVYITPAGAELKKDYYYQAYQQWKRPAITTDIKLEIRLYFGNHRKNDWDNFHKLSMDSLNKLIWLDDKQIQEATVKKLYDKQNPRIELDIYPLLA